MIVDRYLCCDDRRRALLSAFPGPPEVSGIDYIEVESGPATTDDIRIRIFLVKPVSTAVGALGADNIRLTGGVRYPAPTISPAVLAIPAAGPIEHYLVTVPGGQGTDFSSYHLELVTGADDDHPPPFIDPRLSGVDFSFKIECRSDFDCAPCEDAPDEVSADPEFDYRVRDYQGFRRQLLDRLSELIPGFRDDDPVDLTTTLVEALAYRADQQGYRLDWVGTEAFLSTARSRTSLARHARLTDYRIGEGSSARAFARFLFEPTPSVPDGTELAASTPLLIRIAGLPPVLTGSQYRSALALDPIVFETVMPLQLWGWRNHIELYTWGDDACLLPKGATAATLVDTNLATPFGALAAGDLLMLSEIRSPETGERADARPDRRHVVRLVTVTPAQDVLDTAVSPKKLVTVEWAKADALPFDLAIQVRRTGSMGSAATVVCAEAAGNIMLADHGQSAPPATDLGLSPAEVEALRPRLIPSGPPMGEAWRPVLDRAPLSRIEPIEWAAAPGRMAPASELGSVDAVGCLPALELDDDFATWTSRHDLLESGRFSRDFVVETAIDGRATVRFGDGRTGLPPAPGALVIPRARFGVGLEGNIGVGALGHVVLPPAQVGAELRVQNDLPARGGSAPEPASSIRIAAPQAFRRQERAVTAADYAEAATRHPEVANAVAIPRWTGGWQTILIYVDRKGGLPVDDTFGSDLLEHIERFRLMGFDTAVSGARSAPLDIELLVCAKTGEFRSTVAARVRDALRPTGGGSGVRGFFHPDNFTFGSPLHLSQLLAAVMAVKGVQSAEPLRFARLDRLPQGELANGVMRPGEFEVLRLDDDASFPERGRLALTMSGGR